ncbi:MAG TPA: hypothetical protein PLM71_09055 [Syntrophorhabdaceae bacterium]|nr:hypothetical protein [Syntrophorhabdaceae bacterium]HPU30456.1 hypothetical protein [Syntrophorhabdaceae bacterium]
MEYTISNLTDEEKEIIERIDLYQYTGGGYRRASFIDKVCRKKADKEILEDLCRKGLAETGLGGTVAGDTYRACWLTEKGKIILEAIRKSK